jgi:hypothetical protein
VTLVQAVLANAMGVVEEAVFRQRPGIQYETLTQHREASKKTGGTRDQSVCFYGEPFVIM